MNTGTDTQAQTLSFEFTGKSSEYFKIWIVNICLTILTLGIYSAWAKVRTNSYFYGNTSIDNNHFAYLADPVRILKGRLVALVLFALYWAAWQFRPEAGIGLLALGCLLYPFFIVSTMAFRMRNTAYRNIRFLFKKNIAGAYKTFILPLGSLLLLTWLLYTAIDASGFLDTMVESGQASGEVVKKEDFIATAFMLSLLPILPWLDYMRTSYIINHTQFGKAEATYNHGVWGFYRVYILTFLAFFAVSAIFGVVMAVFFENRNSVDKSNIAIIIPVFLVVFYSITFFISGLWKAMRTNMINNHTQIGENQLHSHLKGLNVGWIYFSNTIAIILSLGLLIPWAKIRMANYVITSTELEVNNLNSIRFVQQEDNTAFGEEMGEIFDVDFGI